MQLHTRIPLAATEKINLPERVSGLERLAFNFYWAWHQEAALLFAKLSPEMWAGHASPVEILVRTHDFSQVLSDAQFLQSYDKVISDFDNYMRTDDTWFAKQSSSAQVPPNNLIAYFCAEYGLHESFPIYSGGLGILAGDHAKEASDMGLPFVGIGLLYKRGFFTQLIDGDGKQEHCYPRQNTKMLPIKQVLSPKTQKPLLIEIELPNRKISATAWLAQVGRIPLLLLDTDISQNSYEDRPITSQLYVSGRDMRLHQEIILGIGGVRMLRELQIEPQVWHMNEGHSAFLLVERLREYHLQNVPLDKAISEIKTNSVFTIHTPVPAGNERFWHEHVTSTLDPLFKSGKLDREAIMQLARGVDKDPRWFDMTALGLRLANGRNGVSLLHGQTADNTWRKVTQKPIIGVTNGVHMPTWLGKELSEVFAKQGADFSRSTSLQTTTTGQNGRGRWEKALEIDAKTLWDTHVVQKKKLIEFAHRRIYEQLLRNGKGPGELKEALAALNPDAFLIGFARRFATYKRASLMFSDEKRLLKVLENQAKPVQIIFAGKAHPADKDGQKLIAKVYQQTLSPRFKGKIFFLEDYNMEVGRHLVQGVDMWLNNPRRPLEASGTSGMKAAANGVPNMSILDGWWDEAWDGRPHFKNGFAIGDRSAAANEIIQDKRDSANFYRTLEQEVLPAFFTRNSNGIPEEWVKLMQNSIASSIYDFSTLRMLEDYSKHLYYAK